jgi:hypothetical protein
MTLPLRMTTITRTLQLHPVFLKKHNFVKRSPFFFCRHPAENRPKRWFDMYIARFSRHVTKKCQSLLFWPSRLGLRQRLRTQNSRIGASWQSQILCLLARFFVGLYSSSFDIFKIKNSVEVLEIFCLYLALLCNLTFILFSGWFGTH